jgi:hypothetical protein
VKRALLLVFFASAGLAACDDDTTGPGLADLLVPPEVDLSVADLTGIAPLQRFAVIGDFGVDTPDEARVAHLVRDWHPDFVITVGDNNYPNGEASTIDVTIGQYYQEFIGQYQGKYGPGSSTNRFWPALGNHDWYSMTGAQPYLDYFPALPGNKRYYDVALDNIHLFAVDSDQHEPDGVDATSTQAAWLKDALSQSTACFNLVTFHHPAYSSGDPIFTQPGMRWPFKDWGADLILMGHQHNYERLVVDGTPYIVDGLGGALNRFDFPAIQPESLVRYNDDFGALFVEVYPGRLHLEFQSSHGMLVDEFDVVRDCGTPRNLAD